MANLVPISRFLIEFSRSPIPASRHAAGQAVQHDGKEELDRCKPLLKSYLTTFLFLRKPGAIVIKSIILALAILEIPGSPLRQ